MVILNEIGQDRITATLEAKAVAEKILEALSCPCRFKTISDDKECTPVEHSCTASIGVTMFINHEGSQDEILKQADAAMYQAKHCGRNQIWIWEESTSKSKQDTD